MNIQQINQIFQQQGWQIEPIEETAVRYVQKRCLSVRLYRQLTGFYLILIVVALVFFVGRNLLDLTTVVTLATRRDMVQMLLWLNALILPISLGYGVTLAFLWREADETHIVIAKQEDGSFRVSRIGKREFIRSINEARTCALRTNGHRRRALAWRWLAVCISVVIISSLGVMIASSIIG